MLTTPKADELRPMSFPFPRELDAGSHVDEHNLNKDLPSGKWAQLLAETLSCEISLTPRCQHAPAQPFPETRGPLIHVSVESLTHSTAKPSEGSAPIPRLRRVWRLWRPIFRKSLSRQPSPRVTTP